MDSAESNVLLPEDELQAALAEIEQMSAEDADGNPSLDDGRDESDGLVADPRRLPSGATDAPSPESDPPPAAEQVVSTPSESADQTAAAETAATPDPDPPLGEAEWAAMVAGAEAVASTANAGPASDDAALDSRVGQSAAQKSPETPVAAKAADDGAAGSAPSAKKKPRFKIGKRSSEEGVAEYRPPDERGDARAGAQPVASRSKRVYRALDRALDRINRPFERLGDGQRALVGWVALVTLIVSVLAMALMPLVLPHRDAIVFLQEKRAQLDAPSPPSEEVSDEADDSTP